MLKKGVSAAKLIEFEEQARFWLKQQGKFNASTHRDKIDELIAREKFGPDRMAECESAFAHLYE